MTDIDLPDGPTEESTDRDGFLSYAVEVHALVLGLGAGVVTAWLGRPDVAVGCILIALGVRAAPTAPLRQIRVEPWYAIGGVLAGYLFGTLAHTVM